MSGKVIVLSWLNKLRNIFKDNSESNESVDMLYEPLTEHTPNETRGRQVEARVAYQYPRRSSIIIQSVEEKSTRTLANGQKTNRGDRKRKHETSEVVPSLQQIRRERPKTRIRMEATQQQSPFIQVDQPASTKMYDINMEENKRVDKVDIENESKSRAAKITKKGSRPFRPTEIPSPIYGFSNRQKPNEIVEFELISEIMSSLELKNAKEEAFQVSETQLKERALLVELLHREQEAVQVEEEANQEKESQVDELQMVQEGYQVEEYQLEQEAVQLEELQQVHDTFLLVNEEQRGEILLAEDSQLEETSPTSERIILAAPKAEDFILANHSAVVEEIAGEGIELDEVELVEDNHVLTTSSTDEAVLDRSASKRTHLPFNVMMLKQDKLRLESKYASQQEKEPSTDFPKMKEPNTDLPKVTEKQPNTNYTKVEIVGSELAQSSSQDYSFPTLDLLNPSMTRYAQENYDWIESQKELLNEALKNFGVRASVVNITQGPSVTRFEVQPEPGVKVSKITNLSDDIKLSLAAKDIRIEAPIPGKHTIGIEVPNKKSRPVLISEIITSEAFKNSSSPLTAVLGLDISGAAVVTDLKKMPHGLIAGATGSGKSVCINSILISLLFKATPQELKLLLIDPKMVELAPYNHIPHLVSPVITDVKAATAALKWAVDEMERRYELFAHTGVRDINRFNELAEQYKRYSDKLPFIVIIIDELADLMMMSPAEVEESICRIAQKARACGIHLIIATQRPSVDVITGLIKANVPTRTAFSVSSQIDSRTIIDISGAEKLLGRGDMLFLENGSSKPVRLQGTFVSDAEIDLVVEYVRNQQEPEYLFHQDELLKKAQVIEDEDELFYEACEFVIEQGGASTSSVQRRFKIGYNRAARLIDMMEQQGFISEPRGSKPRDVLITEEELEQIQENTSSTFV
jgi:DNA segregation ATPase FtsK/SpoIIIE, S-DNA-T family